MNRPLQAPPPPGATPLRAVALPPVLPRSLQGRGPAVAMASLRGFGLGPLTGEAVARGFEGMYGAAVEDALRSTGREAFEAMGALRSAEPSRRAPEAGARYPPGPPRGSLRRITPLVHAGSG